MPDDKILAVCLKGVAVGSSQTGEDAIKPVLVGLAKIGMIAKDFHYRATGKSFYGNHLLGDLLWRIDSLSDKVNEVYYMGEKRENPPLRGFIYAEAGNSISDYGNDDSAMIAALLQACEETAAAVEAAKKSFGCGECCEGERKPLMSGTVSVLDEVSQQCLQAIALLNRVSK